MNRRTFCALAPLSAAAVACSTSFRHAGRAPSRLFFTSAGRTWVIGADGQGLEVLEVAAPDQKTWQPAGFLKDGRVLLLSMEARRDGPGRPFEEYYHQTPTHVWAYDLNRKSLTELATRERQAPFYTPQLVLADGRVLMQVIRQRPGQILNMNLDGTDARPFTGPDEGLPYGFSLSPDGSRVAFHLASREGYQIWTCDPFGRDRVRVAADPGHLYFGPSWSPDGRWLAYLDCHEGGDPGHDWADVCLGRPDGGGQEVLTRDQAVWFAATYGPPGNRGGGSNVAAWTPDGSLLVPCREPGSRVPWEYQAGRPDTDHFNREYHPASARGGTFIARLNPQSRTLERLTNPGAQTWDFRATPSPDGRQVAFCRAETGTSPGLWVMDADGRNPRPLSRGFEDRGADHPRWLPAAPAA